MLRGKKGTMFTLCLAIGLWIYGLFSNGTLATFSFLLIGVCTFRLLAMRSQRALTQQTHGPLDRCLLWCRRVWTEKPRALASRLITSGCLSLFFGIVVLLYVFVMAPPGPDGISNPQHVPVVLFYSLAGVLLIVGFPCVLVGALLFSTGAWKSSRQGSAHFATLDEMMGAGLVQRQPDEKNCIEVGQYFHSRVGISEQQQESHVLVVAPSGKGKTSGIIIPALLNECGDRSLVINDVKGELIEHCAGALSQRYRVHIFAPTRPQRSHYYNPLAHLHEIEDVEDLADTWIANTGQSASDPFWDRASTMLLTAAILHITQEMKLAPPFSTLADFLTGKTLDEMHQLLSHSPSRLARRSMVTFLNSVSNNPKLGGSILLEIASRFRLLNNPGIEHVTSQDEFDFSTFVDEASAWFLSIPASEARRLKPLSACFYMQMMKALTKRAEDSPGRRLPYSVVFYLDEFCNAGRIMHFEEYISLVRSAGIAFLLAIQDFGQLNREYGEDIANTIRANAATHMVFPGCGQVECQFYSDRIGDTTVTSLSTGYSLIGEGMSLTFNEGETRRRLMNPDEIRTMPQGTLLLLHSNTAPLFVHNIPYYQRPDLNARVQLPFQYPTHAAPKALPTPKPAAQSQTQQQNQNPLSPPGASSKSSQPPDPFALP